MEGGRLSAAWMAVNAEAYVGARQRAGSSIIDGELEPPLDEEKRKILLIDDSEITLAMEKAVLEARGYEVVATSTLVEFERTLQTWKPHLILTDIHMPEATGADICRTLKNEYKTQDIPIVLFSSLPDAELSKLAEQVGADGYLSKANGLEAMGEKVDELVQSILW
jgi:CheY-like chemotaxis protein